MFNKKRYFSKAFENIYSILPYILSSCSYVSLENIQANISTSLAEIFIVFSRFFVNFFMILQIVARSSTKEIDEISIFFRGQADSRSIVVKI